MTSNYSQAEHHFDLLERLIQKSLLPGNEHLIASARRQLDHLTETFPFYVEKNPGRIANLREKITTTPKTPNTKPVSFHGDPISVGRTITSPHRTYTLSNIDHDQEGGTVILTFSVPNLPNFTIPLINLEAMHDLDELDQYVEHLHQAPPTSPSIHQFPRDLASFLREAFPDARGNFYPDWEHLLHFDPTQEITFPTPNGDRSLSMNARYFTEPDAFGVTIAPRYHHLQQLLSRMSHKLEVTPGEHESIPGFVNRLLQAANQDMV